MKKCGAASYRLSVNCRNTKQIAYANTLMTGVSNVGRPKVSGLKVQGTVRWFAIVETVTASRKKNKIITSK